MANQLIPKRMIRKAKGIKKRQIKGRVSNSGRKTKDNHFFDSYPTELDSSSWSNSACRALAWTTPTAAPAEGARSRSASVRRKQRKTDAAWQVAAWDEGTWDQSGVWQAIVGDPKGKDNGNN